MNKKAGIAEAVTTAGAADGVSTASTVVPPPPSILHRPRTTRLANRRRTLFVFVVAVLLLVLITVVGRAVEPLAQVTDFSQKNLAPGPAHLFGTDWMGRDMFLRTLTGLSTSILIGLLAAGASAVIALILGAAAALAGRKVDTAITWLIDLMLGIPHIVLLILIAYALGKGFWGVTIGVALTHWPGLARVIRAEILQCRESDYVAVARKLGKSPFAVARDHMLPFVFPQLLVGLVLLFPHAILHEAAITFLGFGLSVDTPAIGIIMSESMRYLSAGMWWLALFPGIALTVTVLLFSRAGSNLRRLIDPRSSQE